MELTGKLIKIEEPTIGQSGEKNWKRQNIIFECLMYGRLGQSIFSHGFPKLVCFTVWNDAIKIEDIATDIIYNIEFDIACTEFKEKWYTQLAVNKVTKF
jgi:hypothetical protein